MLSPEELKPIANLAEPSTRKVFNKLRKLKLVSLDNDVADIHKEVFSQMDCLTCANCCKTSSPIFEPEDIDKLAKHLRLKSATFIQQYLHVDEDNDHVLNQTPCPFLGADNYCSVYDHRPKACREYPHTNRKRFFQILELTIKNTHICPAAYEIVERLKKKF